MRGYRTSWRRASRTADRRERTPVAVLGADTRVAPVSTTIPRNAVQCSEWSRGATGRSLIAVKTMLMLARSVPARRALAPPVETDSGGCVAGGRASCRVSAGRQRPGAHGRPNWSQHDGHRRAADAQTPSEHVIPDEPAQSADVRSTAELQLDATKSAEPKLEL